MATECLNKEFFGLGMFVMFLVYFYFSVIWEIMRYNKNI